MLAFHYRNVSVLHTGVIMATTKLRSGQRLRRGIVALVASGALIALAGCSSDSGGTKSGGAGEISGDLSILVSSADGSDAGFKAVTEAFKKKYPKVNATVNAVSNDTYPATKSSQLTAGKVDVFVVKNFVEVPDYAKDSVSDDVALAQAGALVDLTDEPFMKNYSSTVLDAQAIGGKQYAVPTGLSYSTGVYYNKKIFADNNIAVPTTWTELTTAMATLKAKNITPFGIGGKDGWPAGLLMLGAAASTYPTLEAKQQVAADLWSQKASLTDAKQLGVLEKTQTIFDNAQKNFAGAGYDDLPAAFARGDFAMVADGTWNEPTINKAVNGSFDYGYFPFPGSDTASDNALLNGKIELQLGVSASSKNKDAALAWLEFFSDPVNYKTFVDASGFSSAQPNIEQSDFLNSISKYTATYEPAWDQVWIANNKAGDDAVYPFNYPALSPLASSTAAQAAEAAQTAWSAAF